MRETQFYTTASGRCPIREHLNTLPDKTVRKIAWVLRAVRDLERVPVNYLKKLVNTDDIWEIRVDVGRNTFRLLGFFSWTRVDRVDQLVSEEKPANTAK